MKAINLFNLNSHPDFLLEAKRLADFHLEHDNIVSIVVTPQQIYNEFSSGMQDVSAIRDFVKCQYNKENSSLKYLLLFGDGSFDPKNRTEDNTNFIITTETIFLALLGYFILKEKIKSITLISIILGMLGVLLILGSSLSIQTSEQFVGNLVAFIMPISFAVLVIIIRKYPKIDMIPAQFTAGVVAAVIGFFIAV